MTDSNTPDAPRDDVALDPNDPRLTACALGELPEDECAAFEAELALDAEARFEVEALRALGTDLSAALAQEPAVALRDAQRSAIATSASAPTRSGRFVGWAAAAAVLTGVILLGGERRSEAPIAAEAHDINGQFSFTPTFSDPEESLFDGMSTADINTARDPADRESVGGIDMAAYRRKQDAYERALKELMSNEQVPPHYNTVTERVVVGKNDDGSLRYEERVKRLAVRPAATHAQPKADATVLHDVRVDPTGLPAEAATPTPVAELPPASGPSVVTGDPRLDQSASTRTIDLPGRDMWVSGGAAQLKARNPKLYEKLQVAYYRYNVAVNSGTAKAARDALVQLRAFADPAKLPPNLSLHLGRIGRAREQGETYLPLIDNAFAEVKDQHTSTFSIDVDTASYANVRRMLMQEGRLPPADAVRIEEFINAFDYGYEKPAADAPHPLAMTGDVTSCPWNKDHRLARIALQAHEVTGDKRPALNLVFLIDVSGSMRSPHKLPLVKRGLAMLLESLDEGDRVGIVTYASSAGVRLESTVVSEATAIQTAIDGLAAGGSTNGSGGIQLAYEMARRHFLKGASNRVILATDGDFNVGLTEDGALEALIAKEAADGVDLSVLGFGMGNYKDGRLERLSNRGNGNYAYIDTEAEARKALVDDMLGTLVTVAKDVKIQLFFNPATVRSWRLIGYANRRLAARDFNDDRKDAGDVGSGHAVTALYEIVPVGAPPPRKPVDPNPYVAPGTPPKKEEAEDPVHASSTALFTLRLRYKKPGEEASTLVESEIADNDGAFDQSDDDFQWATALAAFGLTLRNSQYAPGLSLSAVEEIAKGAAGDDAARKAFLGVVSKARALRGR